MAAETGEKAANHAGDLPAARNSGTFTHREQIVSRLTARALRFDRPCTQEYGSGCWLCFNLEPWNRVLHHVGVELFETEPGRLALRSSLTRGHLYSDEEEFYDAAYVFSWLPMAHRCVQSVRLEGPGILLFNRPAFAIALALGRSSNVRDLALRGALYTSVCEDELVEGLAALCSLESFVFSFFPVKDSIARNFADLLRRNGNHLKRVVFQSNTMSRRSASQILRALPSCRALSELSLANNTLERECVNCLSSLLQTSTSLTKLTLDDSFPRNTDLRSFSTALEENATLTDLCIRQCGADFTPVLGALKVNCTLKSLNLSCCEFDDNKSATLASVLRRNTALRRLELLQCGIDDDLAEVLAAALEINCALETLDLRINRVDVRGVSAFSAALQKNKAIKTIRFCLVGGSQQERAQLSFQLAEDKGYSRIEMTWTNMDIPLLSAAVALGADSPTELHIHRIYDLAEDSICALLENVATNTRVKVLTVEVGWYRRAVVEALCSALVENRSIRSLEVVTGLADALDRGLFSKVARALLLNTTVTEVAMRCAVIALRSLKSIASLLSSNGTITKFTVQSIRGFRTKRFAILSRGVARNRYIVEFPVPREFEANCASRRVLSAVRRNVGLLNLAVRFATKKRLDRRAALAFEELNAKASFLPHLMKVTGQGEEEARATTLSAHHYIRSNYLRLVGVVRERVVCYPGPGTQADALNHECWCSIAKNLLLSDVVQMQPDL